MYSFILTIKLIPKSNRKIIERDKMYSPNTQIHDHSLFWVGTDALFFFRIAGVKLGCIFTININFVILA
jgi:hypothetical protein